MRGKNEQKEKERGMDRRRLARQLLKGAESCDDI